MAAKLRLLKKVQPKIGKPELDDLLSQLLTFLNLSIDDCIDYDEYGRLPEKQMKAIQRKALRQMLKDL